MKTKAIILGIALVLTGVMPVSATMLPQEVKNYLIKQKKVPTIRHDSVVVYSQDIMYIPVFPAYPEKVDELKIVKTYPSGQSITSLPDIVLFNNNFGLLKLVKTNEGRFSLPNIEEYPIEIRTGEIPQDLMVPRGLVFPEKLAGILGDVYIPLIGSAKAPAFVSGKKAPLPKKIANTVKHIVPDKLKNKLFFVNNYQTEYLKVFSSTVSEPLYSLKTSGVMKDVKPAVGGKYLLAATKDQKNIDVIDVAGEYVSKHIDLTANPSEIVVDDNKNKAYVSSIDDEALFVIDLNTFRVQEKIQLAGAPKHMCVSPDGNKIAYLDIKSSNIYVLELDNNYSNKLITNYPNTSKIILDNEVVFLIARTKPKLRIVTFDLLMDDKIVKTKKDKIKEKFLKKEEKEENDENVTSDIFTGQDTPDEEKEELTGYATSIRDVKTGAKPVDIYKLNSDIFVLCAGDNTVYKYNYFTGETTNTKLPIEGFSRTFSPIPQSNLAVITNMADLKYVVYDMEQAKALQTVPVSDYINTITILERKNEQ